MEIAQLTALEMSPDEILFDIYDYGYFIDLEDNEHLHNSGCVIIKNKGSGGCNHERKSDIESRNKNFVSCVRALSCICISLAVYQIWFL
jgi:hypothetical protein